jgi:hypothetical protein
MVDDYRVGTPLPAISANSVKVVWPDNEGPTRDPALLVPDAISVEFPEECFGGQFGHVFFGLTGSGPRSASVKSTVLLEHSPAAFRAGAGQSIPILPFAVCDEVMNAGSESAAGALGYWSANIESGKGQDQHSWDAETHNFESGPDGLPEITVTIYSTASAGNPDAFIPISFSSRNGNSSDARFQEWIRTGVTGEDLASMGYKELAFPGTIPVASLKLQTLLSCRTLLQNKSGEACLIPLCSVIPASGEVTSLTLKRPVAARIVQVSNSVSGSLKVTLQPCVMATSTAVTASNPDEALNRYVYSVRLIQ